MPPGDGVLTIIHDPEDDPQITRDALAAHSPEHRQITVHPTAGTHSPVMLAADVLAALGATVTADTERRQHLGTALHAFAAAAAWLLVDGIEVVIVLRAHLLAPAARHWLSRLATTAHLRVVAVWHGPRPEDWAEAFRHPRHLVRETEDLAAVLAGARPRERRAPHSAAPLPALGALATCGMARFRAEAYRTLNAEQFAAVDAQYRHGLHAACQWLTGDRLYQAMTHTPARPPAVPPQIPAGEPLCVGRALGRGRPVPLCWGDTAGLQAFLCGLAATAPTPATLIARVRGAQAGALLHGVALQVPAGLAQARGPGLTGVCVTEQVAQAIRKALPNPRLAAGVAIAACTGMSAAVLTARPVAVPAAHHPFRPGGTTVTLGRNVFTVPGPVRPLLDAAEIFCRRVHTLSPGHLFAKIDDEELNQAAATAGLRLGRELRAGESEEPWHAQAVAWLVGDPLHSPGVSVLHAVRAVAVP